MHTLYDTTKLTEVWHNTEPLSLDNFNNVWLFTPSILKLIEVWNNVIAPYSGSIGRRHKIYTIFFVRFYAHELLLTGQSKFIINSLTLCKQGFIKYFMLKTVECYILIISNKFNRLTDIFY